MNVTVIGFNLECFNESSWKLSKTMIGFFKQSICWGLKQQDIVW